MLPTGIVTFLFTDIEGSTRRVERQREAMARALDQHNGILAGAIKASGGHVFKTVGDAVHAAFEDAASGVSAAIAAQRAITVEDWSSHGAGFEAIKVRMGLHTGHVEVRDGEYYGPPVNRAARLTAAGHGGQILMSLATQQLVRDDLRSDVELRDLGVHRLRDLQFAERIYLVVAPGLPVVTTSPKTAEPHRTESVREVVVPPTGTAAVAGLESTAGETSPNDAGNTGLLDDVLATKLYALRPRPDSVPRPRLADMLDVSAHSRLMLISAPAGAGKSSVLAEWGERSRRSISWLSLDRTDGDVVRFLTYVIASLRTLSGAEHIGEAALSLLDSQRPRPTLVLTSLINEIADRGDQVVLVLDDYHQIDSQAVHESLEFLVEHMPANMTLAVATRSDPPLPLARWRLQGEMTELRSADLSFATDEAAALLETVSGTSLDAEAVAALESRTEGWAAGLLAAGLSLRGRDDVSSFVETFAGSHRYVLDYLDEEVVDRQPAEVRDFLLQTAILDRLSGPLCEAVTGCQMGDGAAMLERLERDNLFVTPLDDERRWYRYHQLFADELRHRLQVERADLLPDLHRRASRWFDEQGLGEEAVEHAIRAGDDERAADLIEGLANSLLLRRESVLVSRWVAAVAVDVVRARPRLCIALAWATLFSESLEGAEEWLGHAEEAMQTADAAESADASLRGEIASVRARVASWQGDVPSTVAWSEAAMKDLPSGSPLRMEVAMSMGIAHHMGGEVDAAADAFEEAVRLGREKGSKAFRLTALSMLAEARKLQGRLREADELTGTALGLAESSSGEPYPASSRTYVVLGEIRFEQNLLEASEQCARRALNLGERGGSSVALVSGCMILSQSRCAVGDCAGASAALDRLDREARSYGFEGLRAVMAQFRTGVELRMGNIDPAKQWAREYERAEDRTGSGDILLARVRLAEGRFDEAIAALEPILPRCRDTGYRERELYVLVLLALADQASGDIDRALERLARALDLGVPQGFVRAFVAEGRPMAELLRIAISRDVRPEYASSLLPAAREAAEATASVRDSSGEQPLIEPLSNRELEVLSLVAAGKSNREIADELVIAVGTVKRHLTNINGKLGVNSRTRAVARARELLLIA